MQVSQEPGIEVFTPVHQKENSRSPKDFYEGQDFQQIPKGPEHKVPDASQHQARRKLSLFAVIVTAAMAGVLGLGIMAAGLAPPLASCERQKSRYAHARSGSP